MAQSCPGPNFFLVGAAKSGTTSLAKYLDGHPEVFVCKPKEPNFFAFPENSRPSCRGPLPEERLYEVLLKYSVTDPEAYRGLFSAAGDATAIGDASVRYLYEPTAAERIAAIHPSSHILIVLRDPVERMYSHYHMNLHLGIEPLTFEQAVRAEDERVMSGWGWDWHYRRVGMYAEQVRRFIDGFGADRVLTLFQHDLSRSPKDVWRMVCEHLRVSPEFAPDFQQRALVGKSPRSRLLKRLVWEESFAKQIARKIMPASLRTQLAKQINTSNVGRVNSLSVDTKERLKSLFIEDKYELEKVLGRRAPW